MKDDKVSNLFNTVDAKTAIKIGQKIEVSIDVLSKANDDKISYNSRVEDIREKDICIALPLDDKLRPIIPMIGSPVNIRAIASNCVYAFRSVFRRMDNIPLSVWVIDMPKTVIRTQDREFVRLAISIPIEITIENKDGSMSTPIKLKSHDISGGGISFYYNDSINEDKRIIIKTNVIPSVGRISTFALVKRCQFIKESEKYLIGAEFIDFPTTIQNKLVRYLFTQQRLMINKGVIIK